MKILDLRKELKYLYAPSAKVVSVVDVPCFQFAMIDGKIEPGHSPGNSPAFQQALEALYGISYTLKFTLKLRKEDPIDYPVMALEGLWWVNDKEFDITQPEGWQWTAMMMQPNPITKEIFQEGLNQLRRKRGDQPAFSLLRLESFQEGLSIQVMHLGPYANEMVTIARMDVYAQENGYQLHGKHHEIYLGDPRRANPAKLKTVLRHPVYKKKH